MQKKKNESFYIQKLEHSIWFKANVPKYSFLKTSI